MTSRSDEDARRKLFELIKDLRVAMMATRGEGGKMHARPMASGRSKDFPDELWFLTSVRTGKIEEIREDSEVLLTYADESSQVYVSVTGKGRVSRDRDVIDELWSEHARTWFPNGKDDPEIAAIAVKVETAEYWDTPSSTMVYLYGYLKAVTTGERPDPGENRTVRLV